MSKKLKSRKRWQMDDFEADSDDVFYFIGGYTDGGAPYGLTWEEVVSQELQFRPALKKDSKAAAELIHIAIGDIAEKLTGQTKTENVTKTLADFFREENNRLSYVNTIVADVLDEAAGIVITYPGEDASTLDEPLLNRLRAKRRNENITFDKEADEGDFYIDTLCVHERYRGYGIGTALLREAEKAAKQRGYSRISLNVDRNNPYAKKLYESLGYKEQKIIQINKHPFDYMVKILDDIKDSKSEFPF